MSTCQTCRSVSARLAGGGWPSPCVRHLRCGRHPTRHALAPPCPCAYSGTEGSVSVRAPPAGTSTVPRGPEGQGCVSMGTPRFLGPRLEPPCLSVPPPGPGVQALRPCAHLPR